jgi:hypothetical protein
MGGKELLFVENLLGEKFGKPLSVCKGGSWLYTESGKSKICVPRFEPKGEGIPLEEDISTELLEEEVLFIETDKGLIVKEGRLYKFYPKGQYQLIWKK